MGNSDEGTKTLGGFWEYLLKPLIWVFRYFFPQFECSVTIHKTNQHTFRIENTGLRNLYVVKISPIKGFLRGRYSIVVDEKLHSGIKRTFTINYPYSELEWCIVWIKKGVPIPQLKEVREIKKREFFVV